MTVILYTKTSEVRVLSNVIDIETFGFDDYMKLNLRIGREEWEDVGFVNSFVKIEIFP